MKNKVQITWKGSKSVLMVITTILTCVIVLSFQPACRIKSFNNECPALSAIDPPIKLSGNANVDAYFAGNDTDGLDWATAHVIGNKEIVDEVNFCIEISNCSRFLVIEYCTLSSTTGDGLGMHLINCSNTRIIGCTVYNSTNGVSLEFCRNMTISESSFVNNSGNGINVFNSSRVEILENNFTSNDEYGISMEKSRRNKITFNRFSKNGIGCILLIDSLDNTVIHNRCDTPAKLIAGFPLISTSLLLVVTVAGIAMIEWKRKDLY